MREQDQIVIARVPSGYVVQMTDLILARKFKNKSALIREALKRLLEGPGHE
ncbi:hypothetical protein MUO83_04040 [Candidatus Bathyarchaeota archaeon]|nr:hypothetical protein [Candidatus Bathyarchaeota archaeon]